MTGKSIIRGAIMVWLQDHGFGVEYAQDGWWEVWFDGPVQPMCFWEDRLQVGGCEIFYCDCDLFVKIKELIR